MISGKYWGSAEHRKIISEEKKETIEHVRMLTEMHLAEPTERTKKLIDYWYDWYKQLCNYKF